MSTTWYKVFLPDDCVGKDDGKTIMIRLPDNSEYAGYAFWCSLKLVRYISPDGIRIFTLSFTPDMEFKARTLDGQQVVLRARDIARVFKLCKSRDTSWEYVGETYDISIDPPVLEPVKAVIPECLLN